MSKDTKLNSSQRNHAIKRLTRMYHEAISMRGRSSKLRPSDEKLWSHLIRGNIKLRTNLKKYPGGGGLHKIVAWEKQYPKIVEASAIHDKLYTEIDDCWGEYLDKIMLGATEKEAADILKKFTKLYKKATA